MINGWSKLRKTLSKNDTGETGAHMGGILIPKAGIYLAFFPQLDATEKNPRTKIPFFDDEGNIWYFTFLYYNNKFFGGTRNEYRLTGMTQFISENHLTEGDTLIFGRNNTGDYTIEFERLTRQCIVDGPLKLGRSMRVIKIVH